MSSIMHVSLGNFKKSRELLLTITVYNLLLTLPAQLCKKISTGHDESSKICKIAIAVIPLKINYWRIVRQFLEMEKAEDAEIIATMEQALSIFEKLSLKAGDNRDSEDDANNRMPRISKKPSKTIYFCQETQQPSTASSHIARLSKDRTRHRYKPYLLPLMSKKIDIFKRNSALDRLWGIKLEGDVDELRLTLSEQPSIMERNKSSSCSVEASRYSPWDLADEGVDGEVAELAEYFNQFVNICLKMSALAESTMLYFGKIVHQSIPSNVGVLSM
ncbi:Urease accessory protein UreH [Dirofilaria immitis]